MASVAAMGQPASAAEIDARTPVTSASPSPSADSKAADGKKATDGKKAAQRKAADKDKAASAKAKAQGDRKTEPSTARKADPAKADPKADPKAAAKADPAKASAKTGPATVATPSPTPNPAAAPAPAVATAAGNPSIAENGVLAITSVESLNAEVDVEVTWGEYAAADNLNFSRFEVVATPGNLTCETAATVWTATSCTIQNMPAGDYSFTVTAAFDGQDATSEAFEATVGQSDPVPSLTAAFRDSTMPDHDWTAIELTMKRDDGTDAAEGLGFTVTLPDGLTIADTDVGPTCVGQVAVEEGGSTITMSGATLNADATECSFGVSITSASSGTYELTDASVSGLAGGLTNGVTTQTLTVTGATPTIMASFDPTTVAARAVANLRVTLKRTDENPTSEQTGIGYGLSLPNGLLVAAGQTGNTCGGTLNTAENVSSFTLSGVTITADGECYVQVPVSATTGGMYSLSDSDFDATHAVPDVMTGCKTDLPGISGDGCGPTLTVTRIDQTVSFAPAPSVQLMVGTYPLPAQADSELAVTFSATPESVCTVSGSVLILLGVGICKVTAMQGGDETFNAATPVERDIAVLPPPLAAPVLTAGVSSLTATWTAPPDTPGITGYIVSASPGQATCKTTTATSCVLGGTAGTSYTVTVVARVGDATSDASPASNAATPTAPQPPATVPDTNLTLTTDQGIITTAAPGQQIVFIGTGFASYSTVVISLYSDPIVLGTTVTDALGNFSKPITIPRDLAAGGHTAVAQGVAPDGTPRSMKLAIQVAAASGGNGNGGLAVTGAPIALILLLGLALVAAGVGVTRLSRRA